MRLSERVLIRRMAGAAIRRTSYLSIAGMIALAVSVGNLTSAHADNGIATPHGAIFHSKGWITPAIYRKPAKPDSKKTITSRKSAGANRKPQRTRRTATRSSPKLRSAARARNRKKTRSAKARRIPTRLARRPASRLVKKAKSSKDLKIYAVKVASLGIDFLTLPTTRDRPQALNSITGGSRRINWVASQTCLSKRLHAAIRYVAANFGRVRVNSTCRSRRHNRRVGGARRSWHLKGRAADIRVFGNIRKTARYLRRVVGGYKHYGGGLFHIDTGPRRRW